MSFSANNLPELEAHLATHQTLTEGGVAGALDASIYLALGSNYFFMQKHQMLPPILTYTTGTFISEPSLPSISRHGLINSHLLPPRLKLRRLRTRSISSVMMSPLLQLPRNLSLRLSPRRRKRSLLPSPSLSSRWRSTRLVSILSLSPIRSTLWKSTVWSGTRSPRSSKSPTECKNFRLDVLLKTIRSSLTTSSIRSLLGKMMCNLLIWLACKSFDSLYCMIHIIFSILTSLVIQTQFKQGGLRDSKEILLYSLYIWYVISNA